MPRSALKSVDSRFPPPGRHLSPARAGLWRAVVRDYALEPDALEILRLLCETLDRGEQARELVEKHGMLVEDRFGMLKANEAVAIERDCAIRATRLWRDLDLDPGVAQQSPLALRRRH